MPEYRAVKGPGIPIVKEEEQSSGIGWCAILLDQTQQNLLHLGGYILEFLFRLLLPSNQFQLILVGGIQRLLALLKFGREC